MPSTKGIEDENLRRLINNIIIEVYSYSAESERKLILERQRQGIEIAKDRGVYKGRSRKYASDHPRIEYAKKLYEVDKRSLSSIARELKVSKSTLRRYLKVYSQNNIIKENIKEDLCNEEENGIPFEGLLQVSINEKGELKEVILDEEGNVR
ncbi:helix-turn-helix domain-containing protein [Erysipelothrix aquatica]|uniref:helix-turn-helix domain-containing protein n=1 Tax=Erysipelothrix aquatica TaxID=2683714 RepID=UPI001915270B|nr:helix-turn-helix domain-containing protein [Erysipelothrix aquatica]